VTEYQHFRGACYLQLQGEVAGMRKNSVDIGLEWRGVAGAASQLEVIQQPLLLA